MSRANWISHTCTGGAGNLALARDGTLPMFTDVFGTTDTIAVRYDADDGTQFEEGVGSLNLVTNVLTRSLVLKTWNGVSTFVKVGAAALTLGNPATVRCASLAEDFLPTVGPLRTGLWYPVSNLDPGMGGNFALTAGTLYRVDVHWPVGHPVSKLGMYVGTQQPGSNFRFALYRILPDGTAGPQVYESGALSGASSGTIVTPAAAANLDVPPGPYALDFISDSAIALSGGTIKIMPGPYGDAFFDRPTRVYSKGSVGYGALPAAATAGLAATSNSQPIPTLWVQR